MEEEEEGRGGSYSDVSKIRNSFTSGSASIDETEYALHASTLLLMFDLMDVSLAFLTVSISKVYGMKSMLKRGSLSFHMHHTHSEEV